MVNILPGSVLGQMSPNPTVATVMTMKQKQAWKYMCSGFFSLSKFSITINNPAEIKITMKIDKIIENIFLDTSVSPITTVFLSIATAFVTLNNRDTDKKNNPIFGQLYQKINGGIIINKSIIEFIVIKNQILFYAKNKFNTNSIKYSRQMQISVYQNCFGNLIL